jgi:uncharacterized protein YndB with AHSA1/START domain
MKTQVASLPALKLSRSIKASREQAFAAWTTPREIVKWFGPETCRALSARVDLRAGGEYHIRIHSKEMGELDVEGVFREVKRPSKLVYTWNWHGVPDMEFGESIVTVDFRDKEGLTEVQIKHDHLPDAKTQEDHRHGWNGSLDKLEKQFAGG